MTLRCDTVVRYICIVLTWHSLLQTFIVLRYILCVEKERQLNNSIAYGGSSFEHIRIISLEAITRAIKIILAIVIAYSFLMFNCVVDRHGTSYGGAFNYAEKIG